MIKIKSHKENMEFHLAAKGKIFQSYYWTNHPHLFSHYVTDEFAIKMERVTNINIDSLNCILSFGVRIVPYWELYYDNN
jgi:hypothetical protein